MGYSSLEYLQNVHFMNSFCSSIYMSQNNEHLLDRLETFGFEMEATIGDGDCFFRAVGRQILRLLKFTNTEVKIHLRELGITECTSLADIMTILRKLVVKEWRTNAALYSTACSDNNFHEETSAFEQSGYFSSSLGDAMPLAAANILGIPIVIITAIDQWPAVTITPHTILESVPVYLTLENDHYSSVVESQKRKKEEILQQQEAEKESSVPLKTVSCRCGVNHKGEKTRVYCSKEKAKYKSRCVCIKNKLPCGNACKCKHCGNGKENSNKTKKRKSFKKLLQTSVRKEEIRMSSNDFIRKKSSNVKPGVFSNIEWLILESILSLCVSSEMSLQTITSLFNKSLKMYFTNNAIKQQPKERKENEIKAAISQRKKKREKFDLEKMTK